MDLSQIEDLLSKTSTLLQQSPSQRQRNEGTEQSRRDFRLRLGGLGAGADGLSHADTDSPSITFKLQVSVPRTFFSASALQ
jgi:hypothetical protein